MNKPMKTESNVRNLFGNESIMTPFEGLFPRLFSDFFADNLDALHQNMKPQVNVIKSEDESQYKLQIGVAGYNKEDIKVYLSEQGNQEYVVIKGEHRENLGDNEKYIQQNIKSSEFNVSYPVAKGFELGQCQMENGLLTISFNRIDKPEEEEAGMKEIEIN